MQHFARPPVVLVAPLNWGLGHATRCIPLIYGLQALGCEVLTASDGASRSLLVEEFPLLTHLSSPHTPIRYSSSKWLFGWAMLKLMPRFWRQIKKEQKWIVATASKYHIDAIVADNRYGLAHPTIPSVIITHQLGVRTGYGRYTDSMMQKLIYRYIDRFKQVWVPDVKEEPSLAGALSHPLTLPKVPVQYMGVLNRLSKGQPAGATTGQQVLVLLSGPEPQRTLLEKIILEQAASFTGQLILVRGLPATRTDAVVQNSTEQQKGTNQALAQLYGVSRVRIFDHLNAGELQALLPSVEYIICRSGYTTLMEMIPLHKKLVLIATPGQPEQTYLAAYADSQHYAPQFLQEKFSLVHALSTASHYPYRFPSYFNEGPGPSVLAKWVEQIKETQKGSQ